MVGETERREEQEICDGKERKWMLGFDQNPEVQGAWGKGVAEGRWRAQEGMGLERCIEAVLQILPACMPFAQCCFNLAKTAAIAAEGREPRQQRSRPTNQKGRGIRQSCMSALVKSRGAGAMLSGKSRRVRGCEAQFFFGCTHRSLDNPH